MKVVVFCGGFGVRMGDQTQRIPKPMIPVGNRPILWHIMKWYAWWGHDDFVLCLGYKAEASRSTSSTTTRRSRTTSSSRTARATSSCSAATSPTGASRSSIPDARQRSPNGCCGRPASRRRGFLPGHVRRRLTDAPLADMIDRLRRPERRASSSPSARSSTLTSSRRIPTGVVQSIEDMQQANVRINGGFFVFRREILDYINPGEELVDEPFAG